MQETRNGEDPQRPYARLLEPLARGQKLLRRIGGAEASAAALRLTVCQKLLAKNVAAVVLAVPGMDVLALPYGEPLAFALDPAAGNAPCRQLLVQQGTGLGMWEGQPVLGLSLLDRLGEETLRRLANDPPGEDYLFPCPDEAAVELLMAWSWGLFGGLPDPGEDMRPGVATVLARLWRHRNTGLSMATLDPAAVRFLVQAGRLSQTGDGWRLQLEDEDMAHSDRRT